MRTVAVMSACLTFFTAPCIEADGDSVLEKPSRAFAEMLLAFNVAPKHHGVGSLPRASTPLLDEALVSEAFATRVQEDLARAGLKKTLAEVTQYLTEMKIETDDSGSGSLLGGIRDANEETIVEKEKRAKQKPKEVSGRIIKTGTMKDTIIVKVDRRFKETKRKTDKIQRRSNRVKVHAADEQFAAGPHKIGDIVKIRQTIPMSKEKKWTLVY